MPTRSRREYLNKALAARRSGLSVRRLLELAQKGVIRKHHVRDPESKRTIAVFPVEDLDRLKASDQTLAVLQSSRSGAALQQLNAASGIVPTLSEIPRAWLTAAEAAGYSGLPESFLVELVKRGKLAALDVGIRPGGRWRIARRELDALEGDRHIIALDAAKKGRV